MYNIYLLCAYTKYLYHSKARGQAVLTAVRRSGGPFDGFPGGPDRSRPAVRRSGGPGPVRPGFEAVA